MEDGAVLERARTFAAEPVASRKARHFVLEWLEAHGHSEYAERAALAVSELAANAVLHTSRPFTVSLEWVDEVLLVSLTDSAPELMAVPVPTTGSAVDITSISETGRGLQIVASLASRWGIIVDTSIKTIWAEFGAVPASTNGRPEIVDRRPPPGHAAGVQTVRFLGLPVRLAIASGLDVEDASRDIQWIPPDERTPDDEKLLTLIDQSAPLRLAGRHAAMHAASEDRLVFDVDIDASDEVLLAVAALSEQLAGRSAGRSRAPDEVQAFRRWLMDETMRQRAGRAPRRYGDEAQHPDDVDWLWETAVLGYAALDEDGCIAYANEALGAWLSRDDLMSVAFADLLDANGRADFDALQAEVRATGRAAVPHMHFRRGAASSPAEVRAVLDGDVVRVVVDSRNAADAAEILAAEDRAAESSARADVLIHALQQTLIPPEPPSVPGLDVVAAYHPAQGEVGGDFYDVFEVADNDWCVVLGDVSGKGVDAAIVTSAARHAVRSSALREPVPSGLMHALNDALIAQNSTRFCTVVLARLQRHHDAWVATLTTGGHPFPLLVRHGSATKLGRPGSLLGVFEDVSFHDVSIKLSVGDALVLFTDGVIEARDASGELFGDERLHDAVVNAPASAQGIVDAVMEKVLAHQSGGSSDDIALVVIRRSAP